jgi:anti-sigma regulatory factor (Ser/Thr protein kinase)
MPPTVTQEYSACCQLRHDPAQVSQARRLARETLAEWGLGDYTDHTVLISSELVTNALRHGAGMISLRLYRARRHLRIEVHDHGAGRPVRRHAGTGDESGRGLAVIDGLIAMYHGQRGCTDDDTGPGKTVYVVLQLIANAAGAR